MKFLLHICCSHCGIAAIEELLPNFELTLFWYNPSIHPLAEYQKRFLDVQRLSEIYKLKLVIGEYENEHWLRLVEGLEEEPERGQRCLLCFKDRLEKTGQFAKKNNFDYWGTTLSTGPQKNAQAINSIGTSLSDKYISKFYSADFKKKDGFKKSLILGKKYNFYRQNYCGCVFSQKD